MAKGPKVLHWNKENFLSFSNRLDESKIIEKVDFIGDHFQDKMLLNLMSNSLRLKSMKTNDLFVYNLETNARFGGIVGLHCVAAQEQLYSKVSKETGLDFGIIPDRSASCLRIRDHFLDNYSNDLYEGCTGEYTIYKNRAEMKRAAKRITDIKLNRFDTKYQRANGREASRQEKNAEKIRLLRYFKKHNITTDDIASASLMLIRSATNSASGLHSVFYVGEDDKSVAKHVSFNKEGLFSLFKRNKKSSKVFIADITRITKLKIFEKANSFANMNKSDLINQIKQSKNDKFDFPLESLGKTNLENFAITKYLKELEDIAIKSQPKKTKISSQDDKDKTRKIGSWDIQKVVYRKNLEEPETGKPIITLGHFLSVFLSAKNFQQVQ